MKVEVYQREIYESFFHYNHVASTPNIQRCLYFPDEKIIIGYRTEDQIFGHSKDRIDFVSDNLELLDSARLLSTHRLTEGLEKVMLDVVSKEKQYRESEKSFIESAKELRYIIEIGGAEFHQEEGEK